MVSRLLLINSLRVSLQRRQFGTTCKRQSTRFYRYAIDVHGQLFLHDTVPKNLTSCFKNPQFLDFFFARIKPNVVSSSSSSSEREKGEGERVGKGEKDENDEMAIFEKDWTERDGLQFEEASRMASLEKYDWVSPCQGETNFIRAAKSPIVFRELDEDGTLRWAGSYTSKFDPSSLKVDPDTGYVYHPSPLSPLNSVKRKVEAQGVHANPYGAYSLLSSALVLQRLASGLDVDPDVFCEGKGGSIEWKGKRWEMKTIEKGDLG